MDGGACNFDESATADDGSCTYVVTDYGCDGACLVDSDGDGVCDPREVDGCTDESACNFDPAATDNDSTCMYENPCIPSQSPSISPPEAVEYVEIKVEMTLKLPYSVGDFIDDAKVVFECFIATLTGLPCHQVKVTRVIASSSLKQSGSIDVTFEIVTRLAGSSDNLVASAQELGNAIIDALDDALTQGGFADALNQLMVDSAVPIPRIDGNVLVVSAAAVEVEQVSPPNALDDDAEGGSASGGNVGGVVAGVAVGGMLVGAAAIFIVRRKKQPDGGNVSGNKPGQAVEMASHPANVVWGDIGVTSDSSFGLISAQDMLDSVGQETPEALRLRKKKIKEIMKTFPPKEHRTESESRRYRNLKKEGKKIEGQLAEAAKDTVSSIPTAQPWIGGRGGGGGGSDIGGGGGGTVDRGSLMEELAQTKAEFQRLSLSNELSEADRKELLGRAKILKEQLARLAHIDYEFDMA